MNQQRCLLPDQLDDAWMRVAQRIDADSGDEIQIALAFQIVNIRAFSAAQNQRITSVVLEEIFAFQIHHGLGSRRGFNGWSGHLSIIVE